METSAWMTFCRILDDIQFHALMNLLTWMAIFAVFTAGIVGRGRIWKVIREMPSKEDAKDIKLQIAELDRRIYEHMASGGCTPRPLSRRTKRILKEGKNGKGNGNHK